MYAFAGTIGSVFVRTLLLIPTPACRGDELTYHYKFAIEADPSLKIPCYCGAPSCCGAMN